MTQVVNFQELATVNGKKIAVATLNASKSLNALSGEMIDLLYPQLCQWQKQDEIAMVFLQGEGEKAFCAGGDIVHMYNEMKAHPGTAAPGIEEYFIKEYQLDYLIHTFEKPILVWGSGIVMGGGLGMMVGGSHRIVTEKSRLAMPEVTIGLYPDVGASYFLNRMPENCGLFLGITGASINGIDAKYCHLADYFLASNSKEAVLNNLLQHQWQNNVDENHSILSQFLVEQEHQASELQPSSKLKQHQVLIAQVTRFNELNDIVDAIVNLESEDNWLIKAKNSLKHGSPLSASIAFKQIELGKNMSLADCFKMELTLSIKSGQFGEFVEGVRALLIDKDNSPKWHFENINSVDMDTLTWFFTSLWTKEQHPFAAFDKEIATQP